MTDEHSGGALAKREGALTGAAVSAAVAAAVYGLRKARESGRPGSVSLAMNALESASGSLLPLAEAAAEEAGEWVAKNSPAVIRDRLLPRFIDAFKSAA